MYVWMNYEISHLFNVTLKELGYRFRNLKNLYSA